MRGGGNLGHIIIDAGGEPQAAVLHSGQLTVALYDHSDRGGGRVGYGQRGADRALIELQLGGNRLPAGFFRSEPPRRGGQHRQPRRCPWRVFGGDTQRCVPLDAGGCYKHFSCYFQNLNILYIVAHFPTKDSRGLCPALNFPANGRPPYTRGPGVPGHCIATKIFIFFANLLHFAPNSAILI